MRCHVDIETYSEVELKKAGVYAYAEHESTEVLCLVYRFDGMHPVLWVPHAKELPRSVLDYLQVKHPNYALHLGSIPCELLDHVERGRPVAAHNAQFERVNLNGLPGKKIGFPYLRIDQMVCTAAKSRMHGLPGALGDAAAALDTHKKDDTGRGTMLMLCRPRSGKVKRYTLAEDPEKYAHLYSYCIDDVYAESALDEKLNDLPDSEKTIWQLDQKINDRGVMVDVPMIEIVQNLIDQYKAELIALCRKMTKDEFDAPEGLTPGQREKISDWIRANGYPQLLDMAADTVKKILKDDACPADVKTVLRIYSTFGMKAVAKYETMINAMSEGQRIRGMFMYYGAGTGRWSSMIVQLQNLFRPVIDDCDVAIEAFKQNDLPLIKWLYECVDPMKVFASCVRGMLVAKPGHILQGIDFAGIESRVLAWLFGEAWKLDAFRAVDLDPELPDNYELAYAMCHGIDPATVTKSQRQVGKPIDLGLGFQGGVKAFLTMAATYGVDVVELAKASRGSMPQEALDAANWMWENIECKTGNKTELDYFVYTALDAIKYQWRQGHPATVQGWKDMETAAKLAVRFPGDVWGLPNNKIKFRCEGDFLVMRLPSGRKLYYYKPELHDKEPKKAKEARLKRNWDNGVVEGQDGWEDIELRYLNLTYMGMDTETRQWKRTNTYGGKLTENAVQAIAGDLLRGAMIRLEDAGYMIVMTVHDEIVSEIPEDFGSLVATIKLMLIPEDWALDLPINAEGFRAKRFRK